MNSLSKAFTPNATIENKPLAFMAISQIALFLFIWMVYPSPTIPKPTEVLAAFPNLWFTNGLGQALITSLIFNIKAVGISAILSIGIAYLTVMPFFRPIASFMSKGRFLGLAGLTYFFMVLIPTTNAVKMAMMVFSMTVFFVTGMVDVVASIPKSEYDYARTLRMSEWRIVWEVVILGKIDQAIELTRQNAAIGWMMLTMVEGMFRSDGGIGVLLLNQDKHLHLEAVLAIQISIFTVGIFQDYFLNWIKQTICPYTTLTQGRGK